MARLDTKDRKESESLGWDTTEFTRPVMLDTLRRDRFRDHEWFDATAEFCEIYDQCSFDPSYESLPLSEFVPMVRCVLAQPKRSIYRQER